MLICVLLSFLPGNALPFVTTWRTTQTNEVIVLPPIRPQSNVTIDWGDSTSTSHFFAGSSVVPNHTYASSGSHNVSLEGQFFWQGSTGGTTLQKLTNLVSWGDGFLVDQNSISLFANYPNLKVSAPPNTQPAMLPGARLQAMFSGTAFNSSLDWDLTNVTDITSMLEFTPLNQPITFRNTQGVTSLCRLFYEAHSFNQPFQFDASNVTDASWMFYNAFSLDQVVNLTNSHKLTSTRSMFDGAFAFNQSLLLNTDSVTDMASMFANTAKFNQAVAFNTSQVASMDSMFSNTIAFNQPVTFQPSPRLTTVASMFANARGFNQPVTVDTSNVTSMNRMFWSAQSFASTVNFTSTVKVTDMEGMFENVPAFSQDLSSWDTEQVTACPNFCPWCGLPSFPQCSPCPGARFTDDQNMSVCSGGTRAPTTQTPSRAPSTAAPSTASPSAAPSAAPSAKALLVAEGLEGGAIGLIVGVAVAGALMLGAVVVVAQKHRQGRSGFQGPLSNDNS